MASETPACYFKLSLLFPKKLVIKISCCLRIFPEKHTSCNF